MKDSSTKVVGVALGTRRHLKGINGFPECAECQCYPECRTDCPDHALCLERLPEYKPKDASNAAPS